MRVAVWSRRHRVRDEEEHHGTEALTLLPHQGVLHDEPEHANQTLLSSSVAQTEYPKSIPLSTPGLLSVAILTANTVPHAPTFCQHVVELFVLTQYTLPGPLHSGANDIA